MALMSRDRKAGAGDGPGGPDHTQRYQAFLSYSHADSASAEWLHKAIERFAVPRVLVGRVTENGPVPRSLNPVFRDRHELAASSDLGDTIRAALKQSRFLIVLCSPAAAASRWVNEEILLFKKLHGEKRVLAAIVAGEPWSSDTPGREGEECFPPALRERYDQRGKATGKRAEPIAADLREGRDGREGAKLKLVAGMLGLGLDDLVRRDQQRRQKRLTYIAAASIAGMAVTSGLAVFAFEKRDEARDQRREAEGLVGFMLGDLRDELEPIGKLSALDAVGGRALQYFENQDKTELSDAALAQRSQALNLLGQIAFDTRDLDGSSARYREALTGTAEMVRRSPNDPQRLFDHAQNVFWIGEIAFRRGNTRAAETAWRKYQQLADRMVVLDPTNPTWKLEIQYAAANLGIVLYRERKHAEALTNFRRALKAIEEQRAADRSGNERRKSVAELLAWLADTQLALGDVDAAIAARTRQTNLLTGMMSFGDRDVKLRQLAVPAHQALATLFLARGDGEKALNHARQASQLSKDLIETEPKNLTWKDIGVGAHLAVADAFTLLRRESGADSAAKTGCDLVQQLNAPDPSVEWFQRRRDCAMTRAKIALVFGRSNVTLALAQAALKASQSVNSNDPIEDQYFQARAQRMVGDAQQRTGNRVAANSSWQRGIAMLVRSSGERPWELHERALLLQRLGLDDEAKPIVLRLSSINYHSPN